MDPLRQLGQPKRHFVDFGIDFGIILVVVFHDFVKILLRCSLRLAASPQSPAQYYLIALASLFTQQSLAAPSSNPIKK